MITGQSRTTVENTETRTSICEKIFRTIFFSKVDKLSWVDPEFVANRNHIMQEYPNIASRIYFGKPMKGLFTCFQSPQYLHVNRTNTRTVVVADRIVDFEPVFICLVKNESEGRIEKYFVSAYEYNVNILTNLDPINNFIAGRFVFNSKNDDVLIPVALAEECGRPIKKTFEELEVSYTTKAECLIASNVVKP